METDGKGERERETESVDVFGFIHALASSKGTDYA